ncbi:MAG: DUF1207 domain-containing protein [Elusimicrobiota bacterium]
MRYIRSIIAAAALLTAFTAAAFCQTALPESPAEPDSQIDTRWRPWHRWPLPRPGHHAVFFPPGDIFAPPLADIKQPRFHASWQHYHTDFGRFRVGFTSFGENIGLIRWPGTREGEGAQLGISGAVFAIFNLDSASHDLLNADYVIGFPLSMRSGRWSARARLFHQSSHLGDEFILTSQPIAVERINLSYEMLETLVSWDCKEYRIYGGPSRILSTVTPLDRQRVQLGAEYRGARVSPLRGRPIAGLEWSAWEENAWSGNLALKAGLLFVSPYDEARAFRLFAEYYTGRLPHGQFYKLRAQYWGFGFAFSL